MITFYIWWGKSFHFIFCFQILFILMYLFFQVNFRIVFAKLNQNINFRRYNFLYDLLPPRNMLISSFTHISFSIPQ